MKDFDKSFNRMWNFVIGFIAFMCILMIAMFAFSGFVVVKSAKAIEKEGLKSVIEKVWNGNPEK